MSERPIDALLRIMRVLRDPETGCAWDRAQTFASLAPYTLEEACEVVDVLERGDRRALRGELGDLLFQVVFLSQLAEEAGDFDFDGVAAGIGEKLIRRHPHLFGEQAGSAAAAGSWERIKAEERQARGEHGVLADVPRSLPALSRATKLGKRAGSVGFDWPDAAGAREKVSEEIKTYLPAIRNNILLLLAHKSSADLAGSEGKEKLAREIRREALRAMGEEVDDDDDDEDQPASAPAKKKKKKKHVNEDDLPIRSVQFSSFIIQ